MICYTEVWIHHRVNPCLYLGVSPPEVGLHSVLSLIHYIASSLSEAKHDLHKLPTAHHTLGACGRRLAV
jgi:hypothetical protein